MSASPRNEPTRRRLLLRLALGGVVSAVVIGLLATQVDLGRVAMTLRGARPSWVALGLGAYATLGVVRALRFRLISRDAPISVLCAITSVHQLLLRVMPMRTGELGFAWLMRRSGSAGFTQSLVGLLVLRILDLWTVLVLYALALAVTRRGAGEIDATLTLVIVAACTATLLAISLRRLLRFGATAVDVLVDRLRLDRFARVARLRGSIVDAMEWSASLSPSRLVQVSALTLLQWIVSFAFVYVAAIAMRLDVTLPQSVMAGMGTVVGSLVPLPGIGTFGALEAGWATGFVLVGVSREDAIATAFGFSVISFGYSLVTAALGAAWLLLRRPPADAGR